MNWTDEVDAKIAEYEETKAKNPKGWRYAKAKPVHKYTDGPEDGVVAEARGMEGALQGRLIRVRNLL